MNKNETPKKSLKREALELLRFVLVVLAIVIPIRVFIAQPFIVNGKSMVPTLHNGDYLIIDEISFHWEAPKRGEVIVFRYPTDNRRFLIKRVIGLPNETVTISGEKVTVTEPDGSVVQLKEPYINGNFSSYGSWDLGPDDYFVMGDNRQKSSDSRSWGLLNKELIVGKTFLRLFPLSDISYKPGEIDDENIEVEIESN